jgi:hypothetical protein
MRIKKTLDLINRMEQEGVFARYAITGEVAISNYIESAAPSRLDLFISAQKAGPGSPLAHYLRGRGYTEWEEESVVIEGSPVRFRPVAMALEAEALAEAEEISLGVAHGAATTRVVRAEHLIALDLTAGGARECARIAQFVAEGALDPLRLRGVLIRHRLGLAWRLLCQRQNMSDPCGLR